MARAIQKLGWRQVPTKYCQIVEPRNQIKRFIYCCLCKRYRENFEDAIDADETTVELRYSLGTNYRKDSALLLMKFYLIIQKYHKIYENLLNY